MGAPEPSDEHLLARTRSDSAAFGVFYRRHVEAVLAFAVRRSGDAETAADLTAEVFATALVKADSYSPERGEARAWLYGIARNKLLALQRDGAVEDRARRRLGIARLALSDEGIERVERIASLDVRAEVLADALQALPGTQREALVARVVQEQSYETIGRDADVSPVLARPASLTRPRRATPSTGGEQVSDDFVRDFGVEIDRAAQRVAAGRRPSRRLARSTGIRAVAVAACVAAVIVLAGALTGGPPRERSADEAAVGVAGPVPPSRDVAKLVAAHRRVIAPNQSLPRLDGRGNASLADFRDKVVLITFGASWCSSCVRQQDLLASAQRRMAAAGGTVVGIASRDNLQDARRSAARADVTYPVLLDRSGDYAGAWELSGYPVSALVETNGQVVAVKQGPLDRAWLDVHLAQVLRGTPEKGETYGLTAEQLTGSYSVAQITQVEAEQRESFGIFRRAQRPSDRVTRAEHPFAFDRDGLYPTKYGANLALARTVRSDSPDEGRIEVIPGRGWICVLQARAHGHPGGGGCDRTPWAKAHGTFTEAIGGDYLPRGGWFLYGLMPDGVDTVMVTSADGSQHSLPVRDNVYTGTVIKPRKLSFTAPDGSERVESFGQGGKPPAP